MSESTCKVEVDVVCKGAAGTCDHETVENADMRICWPLVVLFCLCDVNDLVRIGTDRDGLPIYGT